MDPTTTELDSGAVGMSIWLRIAIVLGIAIVLLYILYKIARMFGAI